MFEYIGNLIISLSKALKELGSHFSKVFEKKEELKVDTIRSLEVSNKSLKEENENLRRQLRELSRASEELRRSSRSNVRKNPAGASSSQNLLDIFGAARNSRPSVRSTTNKTQKSIQDIIEQMKKDLESLK